jgi:hypothetical protein
LELDNQLDHEPIMSCFPPKIFESSKFFRNPQEKTREKMTETIRVKRLTAGPFASMVTY